MQKGNLLRTPDGRLCILDWGMVTTIQPNLQITLIEHMAHLTSADYEEIPNDLLLLGFIPESKKEYIDDTDIVETLADIYSSWSSGGGAASVNVNEVVNNLQGLAETRGVSSYHSPKRLINKMLTFYLCIFIFNKNRIYFKFHHTLPT